MLVHHPEKHCYCKPTEYCESGAYISLTTKVNPQRGSCVEIDPKNSIYDSPCIQNLNSENLVFGYNHLVFCGLANYDPSGAVRVIEWQGRCWMGKCRFCGSEPIPGLPISLCPDGRSCLPNGRLEYAYVGSLSWPFWQYNPMIPLSGLVLLFAFLTFVSVLVYVTSWYCRNRRKMADQQEYHTVE
ncbi:MAG: hypothetical protein Q8P67_16605 [archaeon]|nr:hypothetical protein [archaeon]